MAKIDMYNKYEAITSEAQKDFKDIESYIGDCVRELSNNYRIIDIEHTLQQYVSTICSEKRLRDAMAMTIHDKQQELYDKCDHKIEWFSDGVTAFGGENRCTKCGYIESYEDGR